MELKMETVVRKASLLTLALNESDRSPEFLLLLEVSSIFSLLSRGDMSLQLVMFGIGTFLPSHSRGILHVMELNQSHKVIWLESVPPPSY